MSKAPGIYARLYCSSRDHPTVSALPDGPWRAYFLIIAWSRERLTDGHFTLDDMVAATRRERRVCARHIARLEHDQLVIPTHEWCTDGARLAHDRHTIGTNDAAWMVADYAAHQETRAEVEAKREAASRAGKRSAQARTNPDGTFNGSSNEPFNDPSNARRTIPREREREEPPGTHTPTREPAQRATPPHARKAAGRPPELCEQIETTLRARLTPAQHDTILAAAQASSSEAVQRVADDVAADATIENPPGTFMWRIKHDRHLEHHHPPASESAAELAEAMRRIRGERVDASASVSDASATAAGGLVALDGGAAADDA